MILEIYTLLHVIISLIGIFSGLVVLFGLLSGIISLLVLAVAVYARYPRQLAGHWRWIYVVTAVIALYLNVFVAVVQAFEKVPALKVMAPAQTEPPFKVTQLVVLALFVVLGIVAAIRFRPEPIRTT